jgi:hypothetical protein
VWRICSDNGWWSVFGKKAIEYELIMSQAADQAA